MNENDTCRLLLHDVVGELTTMISEAKVAASQAEQDFEKGRHLGLYEALSLIEQQAKSFGVAGDSIGLGGANLDDYLIP